MTDKPTSPDNLADRSLELALEFLREQVEYPERLAEIPCEPTEPTIVLLPDNDPELAAYNLQLGMRAVHEGRNVYFRHVPGLVRAGAG